MEHYTQRQAVEQGKSGRAHLAALLMEKTHRDFQAAEKAIRAVSSNLDFIQMRVQMSMHSGPRGLAHISVNDLIAQAPIFSHIFLSKAMNMGYIPPVPYIIAVKPLESGDVHIEVHVGDITFTPLLAQT